MASPSTSSPTASDGLKPSSEPGRQQTSQAVPRKRRRRTPISNAAEDCSACRKRQVRCDRVRPYCSQCVEIGRDCPGYKTTLTWGVGVASRGKLRGLALPIANSAKVQGAAREVRRPAGNTGTNTSSATNAAGHPVRSRPAATAKPDQATPALEDCAVGRHGDLSLLSPQTSGSMPEISSYHAMTASAQYAPNMSSSAPSFSGWDMSGYQEHLPASKQQQNSSSLLPRPLQRVHTHFAVPYEDCVSPASTASWSDVGYQSPTELPHTPEELPMWDPYLDPYPTAPYAAGHQSPSMASMDGSAAFLEPPRSCPALIDDMSSSVSSEQTSSGSPELAAIYVPDLNSMSMPNTVLHGHNGMMLSSASYGAFGCGPEMGPQLAGFTLSRRKSSLANFTPRSSITSIPKNIGSARFSSLPPRLQYLLHYYETAICPFLSALEDFNPYVCHILPLAQSSKSLQNAIAALSLNNMRMRKIHAPESSLDASYTTPLSPNAAPDYRSSIPEITTEEQNYKGASIELLDRQLTDPSRTKDDAVLATLLVLCLYHCCDSGFSKFRTQLTGVQKLINMRDRSQRTSFICWVEMFFIWFDVFTSAVNNRETEIRPESLESLNLSLAQGPLEYHSGCDLHLFQLIARLGRLNLLSQNLPVREKSIQVTPRATKREAAKDYYSLKTQDWSTTVQTDPPWPATTHTESVEHHSQFWSEWHDVRKQLQSWDVDTPNPFQSASGPKLPKPHLCSATPAALPPRQQDMFHINEAFRYAALIYVERLSKPSLSSSALDFQNLVAQSLYHISQVGVTSCVNKFLLWPLFITGTESIDEMHRSIIRERCIKIHKESGFFNNLSTLEVLERVWKQDKQGVMSGWISHDIMDGQAFRWRNSMDRVDGEYIII